MSGHHCKFNSTETCLLKQQAGQHHTGASRESWAKTQARIDQIVANDKGEAGQRPDMMFYERRIQAHGFLHCKGLGRLG
jgi:hypothetical protein